MKHALLYISVLLIVGLALVCVFALQGATYNETNGGWEISPDWQIAPNWQIDGGRTNAPIGNAFSNQFFLPSLVVLFLALLGFCLLLLIKAERRRRQA